METSRKHGSFDMRWPSVPEGSARARPHLTLVRTEPIQPAAALAQEREVAGTQRLLAAMAAQRAIQG